MKYILILLFLPLVLSSAQRRSWLLSLFYISHLPPFISLFSKNYESLPVPFFYMYLVLTLIAVELSLRISCPKAIHKAHDSTFVFATPSRHLLRRNILSKSLISFVFVLILLLPLYSVLKSTASMGTLNFHATGISISTIQRTYLALVSLSLAIIYPFSRHLSFAATAVAILYLPICYFSAGFRSPLMVPIVTCVPLLLIASKRIRQSHTKRATRLISKNTFQRLWTPMYALFGFFFVTFLLRYAESIRRGSELTESLFISTFNLLFYINEAASGASHSVGKLVASLSSPPSPGTFNVACVLFNQQSYSLILPRSLWNLIAKLFDSTTCISPSSILESAYTPTSTAEGYGTASNTFADFFFFFSDFTYIIVPILLLTVAFVLTYAESRILDSPKSTSSKVYLLMILMNCTPFFLLWRTGIYNLLSIDLFLYPLLLLLIRYLLPRKYRTPNGSY